MTTVRITKQPTYRLGPRTGIRCEGSVKSEDVEVTDDLLVHGDAEVVGTLYVGTLSSGADVSTDHIVSPLTVDAGSHLTAAAGVTNIDYALSTGTTKTTTGPTPLAAISLLRRANTLLLELMVGRVPESSNGFLLAYSPRRVGLIP